MGEIKQGILGGFSGKVGTVVGGTWKDVRYMRALAINVNNPNTVKQQNQRGKFAMTMAFLTSFTPYLRVTYRPYADGCSEFNAATSYILRNAISGEYPDLSIDYERVLVARGSLMPVLNAVANVTDGKVTFNWEDNSGMGDAAETDLAMPLVFNKVRKMAVYSIASATRVEETAELQIPDDWKGEALAVYLAFGSDNGKMVTNSICLKNDLYEELDDSTDDGDDGGSSSDGDGSQVEDPLG